MSDTRALRLGLALRALQDRDFRVERLVQLGIDVNGAEAQGEGIRCAQRERYRERQLKRSFHLDSPPTGFCDRPRYRSGSQQSSNE